MTTVAVMAWTGTALWMAAVGGVGAAAVVLAAAWLAGKMPSPPRGPGPDVGAPPEEAPDHPVQ